MKLYKARVVHEVVVSGETVEDALTAIYETTEIDGAPMQIERFTQLHSLNDLPRGWTGDALPFSINTQNEQRIAYWLKAGE